jgi:hypothetical protein
MEALNASMAAAQATPRCPPALGQLRTPPVVVVVEMEVEVETVVEETSHR